MWIWNNFDKNGNKCKANYLSLPVAGGQLATIDGKSLGCKLLHGTFVALNPFHCTHTSFRKQEDTEGVLKCQKSKVTTPKDIFTNDMLGSFATVGENVYGYDADLLFDPKPESCF